MHDWAFEKKFPLIKLAKKLKEWFRIGMASYKKMFPLIKLAKKLKVTLDQKQQLQGQKRFH